MYQDEEKELDLKDLTYYLLLNIKKIILLMILGGIIGASVCAYQYVKIEKTAVENADGTAQEETEQENGKGVLTYAVILQDKSGYHDSTLAAIDELYLYHIGEMVDDLDLTGQKVTVSCPTEGIVKIQAEKAEGYKETVTLEQISDTLEKIDKAVDGLTQQFQTISQFKAIKLYENAAAANVVTDDTGNNTSVQSNEVTVANQLNYKYIVLGLLVGAVLGIALYVLRYTLASTVQDSKEYFGTRNIATFFTVREETNKYTKWIMRHRYFPSYQESTDNQIELLASKLNVLLPEEKKIAVAKVGTDPNMSCIQALKEKLENEGVNATFVCNVISEASELKKCEAAENVLLISEIGKTKKAEIEKAMADLEMLHTNILGIVMIVNV